MTSADELASLDFSVVLPAKNEASSLRDLLPKLVAQVGSERIIVVDDGSTDDTRDVCQANGVRVISHPYSKGNGASVKTGVRACHTEFVVLMDGDGQHDPDDIPRLLACVSGSADMAVGARTEAGDQANAWRHLANRIYNVLASWMTGQSVRDLTSGFRAVRRAKFREFLYLLPNGFSYPTTITMAFFRAGYSVVYEPIRVSERVGESHLRIFRDGVRFLLIIFRVGTLYSPLKVFFPASLLMFLAGCGRYAYTYIEFGRFTNMSALLFSMALMIFLMGLISEQITALMYRDSGRSDD